MAPGSARRRAPSPIPSTASNLPRCRRSAPRKTTQAVEAAERAFPAWAKLTAKQRSNILRKWFDLIIANREDLALILTSEQGKPLAEALGEVDIGGAYVEFFAEEARRVYGETIPTQRPDARLLAIKQPIGVCGAITPWNFPCSMITRKVSPALAAGCTVVLKPANETPLTALALVALAEKAGVPKGVFNILTGNSSAIGKVLVRASRRALRRLHRLDRSRQDPLSAGRCRREEARPRTRRQRAVRGVRRRRYRCRGRGRHRLEVPQHGPDLRLRQPHLRPGQDLRRVRREAFEEGRGDEDRRRHRSTAWCRAR